mmetsp:Transcript_12206/g.48980  ORF Transcript_12206/g.48980 Transcript_12206/m.48980 type:complete len:260 (+) Transcript_12206:231-1010(+)
MRAFSLVALALGCRRIHSCSLRSVFLAAARACVSAAHRASRPSRYAAYPPRCLCDPPTPSSSSMSGQTLSMNARSCETSSTAVLVISLTRFSSHSTPSTDRWFVGSSRTRRSGSSMSAAASATRLRCPPESSPILRFMKSSHPSISSAMCALFSVSHALFESISSRMLAMAFSDTSSPAATLAIMPSYRRSKRNSGVSRVYTASNTLSSSSNGGSCSRNAVVIPLRTHSSPSSRPASFPARTCSSVDFPEPLGPTTATR